MKTELMKIEHLLGPNLATYDPYDLWKTKFGQWLKKIYYNNGKITIPIIAPFSIIDAYAPKLIRIFIQPQEYPIVRALASLSALNFYEITGHRKYLELASVSVQWLQEHKAPGYHGACWGLNMPWMTRHGLCSPSTPYITSTPYCVEALLRFSDITGDKHSLDIALSSLEFLENDLPVMFDNQKELALSYSPYGDHNGAGRIVINGNTYAMMMYAILANRLSEKRTVLLTKANRLFNFVKSRQNSDGSWFYYGDEKTENFIDCFHSCFVLKNLIKYGKAANVDVVSIVDKGLEYIIENFLDSKYFLARRFSVSIHPSQVKFDLYDQAEFLNVLCIAGRIDLAKKVHDSIMKYFYLPEKRTLGYQIDIFGILNKIQYLRWAVMPTVYAFSEYHKIMEN